MNERRQWQGEQPPWQREPMMTPDFHRKLRPIFLRFMGFLLVLALPMVGLGIFFGTLITDAGSPPPRLFVFLGTVCGFPLLMVFIIGAIGSLAFRSLGMPLANIMAAADAVADGDLSTRVEEKGPGEFRRMARSFNRMTEELERADQQRRNLTADVAHELRTPLHILQGNLEGLQDGVYEPTTEHIDAMLDETRMLSRLVEDLQTLSLTEAGQLPLRMEPVDVAELLADVGTSFSGPSEASGIDLQIQIIGLPEDLVITGDVERLDQVLSNLMGNALRHTPPGGSILLKAAANPGEVRITIRDTGEGISPEDLPYVFDRFWRADKSRQRQSGAGSGLGLAIAKQFIQAHGGTISVESQVGNGTTFMIDLPQKQERPAS
jgi:two-component system OmpR family sensor kinase/two-component system sensor histidine kinase BaeS